MTRGERALHTLLLYLNLHSLLIAEANSRKKKVYEQQENEENPLRCPVKLYEFYISKWYVILLLTPGF